jgi:hypothetical protein
LKPSIRRRSRVLRPRHCGNPRGDITEKCLSHISLIEEVPRISYETRLMSVLTAHKIESDYSIFMVPE